MSDRKKKNQKSLWAYERARGKGTHNSQQSWPYSFPMIHKCATNGCRMHWYWCWCMCFCTETFSPLTLSRMTSCWCLRLPGKFRDRIDDEGVWECVREERKRRQRDSSTQLRELNGPCSPLSSVHAYHPALSLSLPSFFFFSSLFILLPLWFLLFFFFSVRHPTVHVF